MDINNLDTGFKVNNILLMFSSFKREVLISLIPTEITHDVNIDVQVQYDKDRIAVQETLEFKQLKNTDNSVQVDCKIVMLGIFDIVGQPNMDPSEFGEVNGAAIVFPYLRESLSSLCVRAGIGNIILPPFNFTRRENGIKENEERQAVAE